MMSDQPAIILEPAAQDLVEAVLPVVVYTHGGGWILGNAATHDRATRAAVDQAAGFLRAALAAK